MNKIQAYNDFWNSFGIPAWDETAVPDKTPFPYITFSVGEDDFNRPVSLTASIWYRSKRWDDITDKLAEISNRITMGGVLVTYDGGAMWINKGNPFAQRLKDEDDSIRRIFMNVEVEYFNS